MVSPKLYFGILNICVWIHRAKLKVRLKQISGEKNKNNWVVTGTCKVGGATENFSDGVLEERGVGCGLERFSNSRIRQGMSTA